MAQERNTRYEVGTASGGLYKAGEALMTLRPGGKIGTVWELITPHVDIVTHMGEALQNPEINSNCLI